jgi:hypothetical protein
MTADMLGPSPEHGLLVGVVGECHEPGQALTNAVRQSVGQAVRLFTFRSKVTQGVFDLV